MHAMLRNLHTKMGLSKQARVLYNGTQSAIKSIFSTMIVGELQHWAMAARSIVDLKAQGRQNASTWKKDYNAFISHMRHAGLLHNPCLLDETNAFAFYMAFEDMNLNLQLSFQNNATVRNVEKS